jgi:enoyl-CoA hydratase
MAFENLIVSDRGHTRTITINRTKVLNALNRSTLLELQKAFSDLEEARDVRAVIVTGGGEKAFVAGADISEMKSFSPIQAEAFSRLGHDVLDGIGNSRVPVIAAVNGFALGGGLELALACDFIYASHHATLGLVETKLGLIPGFGGVARLTRRVGEAMAKELIFAGKQIKADEALRIGLVNLVTDEDASVVDAALASAETIADRGPYAVGLAKSLIRDGVDADWRAANAMEQRCFGLVFSSKDHDEGINAFMEKRKPQFEGH